MRRHFPLRWLLLATLFSATLPMASPAQCTRSANSFLDIDFLKNNPFHAELDATKLDATKEGTPSTTHISGSVDRDSQGRVRIEHIVRADNKLSTPGQEQEAEQHLIVICDPIGHALITIDSLKRSAQISRSAPPHRLFENQSVSQPLCDRKPRSYRTLDLKIEDLGTRSILGLQARGLRVTSTSKPAYSNKLTDSTINQVVWCSDELGAVLLDSTSVARGDKTLRDERSAFINVVRTEPDPALFQIPPGFTVTDEDMKSLIGQSRRAESPYGR